MLYLVMQELPWRGSPGLWDVLFVYSSYISLPLQVLQAVTLHCISVVLQIVSAYSISSCAVRPEGKLPSFYVGIPDFCVAAGAGLRFFSFTLVV